MFRVGVIGCGGRGREHAEGYRSSDYAQIVACADLSEGERSSFSKNYDVERSYPDYRKMLEQETLDIVSVCTWTGLHREMIETAAASGVRAIHSEKPMAPSWGDSKRLYQACVDAGVIITFCHQRRFGAQFIMARNLVREGAVGQLLRV